MDVVTEEEHCKGLHVNPVIDQSDHQSCSNTDDTDDSLFFLPVSWFQIPGESVCVQNQEAQQGFSRIVGFYWMAEALQ